MESLNKPISPKDHKMILVLLVLIIVLIGISIVWVNRHGSLNNAPQHTDQTDNTDQPKKVGYIEYNTEFPVLKTARRAEDSMNLQVLNIGRITQGEFKDKILALALYEYGYAGQTAAISMYVYYISDDKGNVVAWNNSYLHNIYAAGDDYELGYPRLINFSDYPEKDLSFLPKEFSNGNKLLSADRQTTYTTGTNGLIPKSPLQHFSKVGPTESGLTIWKDTVNEGQPANPYLPRYYVELPFGYYLEVSPEPNFFNNGEIPQLSWTTGSRTVSSYRYGWYAYGWDDCFRGITLEQVQANLVQTGITIKGDPVYEIDQQKFPSVYVCLHQKTKRYVYNPETQQGSYEETITYSNFVPTHPMFFWKNAQGDLLGFLRTDVVPAAEKAKPVVYLYPEKDQKVEVKVAPVGGFTVTIPEYDNGWVVDATPEGVLTNTKDNKVYPYLFWEGGKDGIVKTPEEGFVVAKENVASTLYDKLAAFGLNAQEQKDFVDFWSQKLNKAPYYFITFISRSEIDRVAPMTITPRPDTVIRVLMDYKPLEKPIVVKPLEIEKTERKGFTTVEWGGIVR